MNVLDLIESQKRLLTAVEVARYLGCSDTNVRDLAVRGILPAVRIGGMWRFDPENLARRLRELEGGK